MPSARHRERISFRRVLGSPTPLEAMCQLPPPIPFGCSRTCCSRSIRTRGSTTGSPSLHAAWLAAVDPKHGEDVVHVGCGNGFYSAVLASLVAQTGTVAAFEIEPEIAATAERHLAPYRNVAVYFGSGATGELPVCDVVYVNAASGGPLEIWLDALRPGGRLVFPWQPDSDLGVSMLITKTGDGLSAKVLGPSRFIALRSGAGAPSAHGGRDAIWRIASLIRTGHRQPDATSVAVFDQYWFSTTAC